MASPGVVGALSCDASAAEQIGVERLLLAEHGDVVEPVALGSVGERVAERLDVARDERAVIELIVAAQQHALGLSADRNLAAAAQQILVVPLQRALAGGPKLARFSAVIALDELGRPDNGEN